MAKTPDTLKDLLEEGYKLILDLCDHEGAEWVSKSTSEAADKWIKDYEVLTNK